ncbi:unnamed protein product [Cylindrotheca closterium]|uniref:Uncharacterized protein n=1 Tax=Cylindrotheca closterium TaxID=2856 RepID=A0AAD2CTW1_9STRA|nr:unnamed protein product [Cylindrotheca closterium]
MMQVPSGMQLIQIPTQGGGTVTVPYSLNANGEIAFSGMQLSQQGFSGAQVRQGFDAIQAQTPQAVKTGYFDMSNVFHDAIKEKDENGNDVYLIPCPTGTTNVKLQADWHYASEDEDLPDLATEANQGLQFIQSRRKERDPFGLYDHVIMDSGCTNTTICNGELMHGLRHAEKELDMHTKVGSRVLDKEGFLGRFPPPVYHDEDGIANVLAMREMIAAGYHIIMDTDADNAFIVHCDGNRKMRFVNCKGVYVLEQLGAKVKPGAKETSGMYRRQLSNLNNQPHSNKQNGYAGLEMTSKMATARKNKEGFTPRQVRAAMEARSAMHILNAPSTKSLKYVIRSGLIKNCPITKEAINHAKAIFGPDASTLKSKSTRPTPKKTYDDFFSPPEKLYQHNRSITVCIHHMEIKNAKFLTCIDTTHWISKIFRRYNKAGFQVKIIKCDWAFIPLTDDMLDDMGVTIDPTAAGDHEPTAERNNRTLKERVRVVLARLPYKVVPKVITECLGRRAAELLNVFPQKDSISSHFSPQQLIDIVNINYKSDMVAELGQNVHAIGTDSNN